MTKPRPLLTTETPIAELRHWCEADPSDVVPRGLHALACARDGLGSEACPYPHDAGEARRAWLGVHRTAIDIANTPPPDDPVPSTLAPSTLAPSAPILDTPAPGPLAPDAPVPWWQRD